MSRSLLFNKPFRVLSQFSAEGDKRTLAEFIDLPGVYPAGRLDYDSEGLMLLTDDGALQARVTDPRQKMPKTYLAQVEGVPRDAALEALAAGVELKDGTTRPARVETARRAPDARALERIMHQQDFGRARRERWRRWLESTSVASA